MTLMPDSDGLDLLADPPADPVVAAALEPMTAAADAPAGEQLAVYGSVHRALQVALDAEIS